MQPSIVINNKTIKENIFWLDPNVNAIDYRETYYYFKSKLVNYNLILCQSIDKLFEIVEKNEKYLNNLFYVIVNDSLADQFFNTYTKKLLELNIIAATIVFAEDKEKYKKNSINSDKFLNPGGIVYKKENVVKFILGLNEEEVKINNNDNFFYYINKLSQLSLPLFIDKIFIEELIEPIKIKAFNYLVESINPDLTEMIQPFEKIKKDENEENIPYYLLGRIYMTLYATNQKFRDDIHTAFNIKGGTDLYKIFIYIVINAIENGYLKYNKNDMLYRADEISEEVYEKLIIDFNKLTGDISFVAFFSKNFLNFTKSENECNKLINIKSKNIPVKFIVEKPLIRDNNIVTNVDIELLTRNKKDKNVVFLPFTFFEITEMIDVEFKGRKIKEIHLKYITEYKKELNKYLLNIEDADKLKEFKEESIKTPCGDIIFSEFDEETKIIENIYNKHIDEVNDQNKFILIYNIRDENNNFKYNIFGKKFVEKNKDKCYLYINNQKVNLCEKCEDLKLGPNEIKLVIKRDIIYFTDMFKDCPSLVDISSLKKLDTSKSTALDGMFDSCINLEDISSVEDWDLSNCQTIENMFRDCEKLSYVSYISKWSLGKCKNFKNIFKGCKFLDLLTIPENIKSKI